MTKWLLLTVTACALAPAVALGASQRTGRVGCAARTVALYGVVDASPGVDYGLPYGLLVDVDSANTAGRAYMRATQPVTILVDSSTHGNRTLAYLQWPDRIAVTAQVCSRKLARGATPTLQARSVTVQ